MPSPGSWPSISRILDQVLELPREQRIGVARTLCGDDQDLRRQVEILLEADAMAGDFLERPAGLSTSPILSYLLLDDDESAGPDEGGRIGPWRLVREIGRGGMGVVWLAERADGQFEQRVALKLLKRGLDTDEVLARFLRERQILARLQHPNIARLIDGGATDDGRPYLAMEYVEGRPINVDCDARGAPMEERLRLLRDACDAVQYAHGSLVVHRDLKPSNILVTGGGQVKLLDFGIARLLSPEGGGADATLTRGGLQLMTPQYAAPEQVRGEPATTATDVYGLGLVLYELLTGRRPYAVKGSTAAEIERAILDTTPEPPSRAAADPARLRRPLRGDLDAIVMTALRKEPARRYPTAEALAQDIDRLLRGLPVRAHRDSVGYRVGKFVGRHRVGVAATTLAAVSLVAGLAGTLWQAQVARQEARQAKEVKNFLIDIFEVSDPSQSRGEQVTARELLDQGALRIEKELGGQPAVQADITGVLADVYEKLGLHEAAEPLAKRSLDLLTSVRGSGDPVVGTALRRQGMILYGRGRYDDAQRALRQALDVHRRTLGQVDAEVAEDLDSLAVVLRGAGKIDEAETMVRDTLAIRLKLFGREHAEVAASLNNLAVILRERGRFEEAEPLYREALAIRRGILGADHPDVAITLNNLAALLRQRGRFEEAEKTAREALAINRKLYGEDNPNTITTMNALGAIVQSLGRYDEAESLDRAVLDYWKRHNGEQHPNAVVSLNNLASLLREKGDYAAAGPMFRRLVEEFPLILGPKHPFNAVALTHLGVILREQGKFDEAEIYLRRAFELRKSLNGEEHPETATVTAHLGVLEEERGRLDAAEGLLRRSLAVREKGLGPDHPATAAGRLALGSLLRERGSLDEAAALQRTALETDRKVYPEGHPEIALAAMELGRTETARNEPARAEPLLKEALGARRERFGEGSWKTAETKIYLAEALAAAGRASEARALLQVSLPLLRRQPGPASRLTRNAEEALRRLLSLQKPMTRRGP